MVNPLALLGTLVRAELFMACAITVGVGGIAVWVTPKAIHAVAPPPEPLGVVRVEGDAPDDRAELLEGLRRTLEGCVALVGETASALALWEADRHDLGAINVDEILLLTHSPSLRTLVVVYQTGGASEKRVDAAGFLTARGLRRFRTSPEAARRVVATGVSDVSITTSPGAPGEAEVALTLTWEGASDDAQQEAGASRTTLRVRLRRVEGLGR